MDDQPDFERLSNGLANASEELHKFPNVPAINQGQQILTALNVLQTRMNEGFHALGGSLILTKSLK